jgi:hypothetical protein
VKLTLPSRVSAANFQQALKAFEAVVGKGWVLATDEDRDAYSDIYAPGPESASRSPQSRNWRCRSLHSAIDVAQEHANFWRTLRKATPRGRVVGLTAWSDLVLVRGLLEEKGLRLRAEARCGRLFYWEMS